LDAVFNPHFFMKNAPDGLKPPLWNYPLCVALAQAHRFARLKSISLEKVAAEPLIGFCRKDYPEYYVGLDRIFNPLGIKPRVGWNATAPVRLSPRLKPVEASR
jgi:hypothetical protein